MEKQQLLDDVEELPQTLYKYYKPNPDYDKKRLLGELFFSSPLKFNDALDSQLKIENNAQSLLKENKFIDKLIELGYTETESKNIEDKFRNPKDSKVIDNLVDEIYKKQLEKLGILCLTTNSTNPIMWGYYTENEGYCLGYDTSNLLKDIVISFANNLSESLTNHLLLKKKYGEIDRDNHNKPNRCLKSQDLFTIDDVGRIENKFLANQSDENTILFFLRNLYVKRCWGRKVLYEDKLDKIRPTLFFDNNNILNGKYYTKLKAWEKEDEYRLILSLGGNNSIKISDNSIKKVIFGCNMSTDNIRNILSILETTNSLDQIEFSKIIRSPENGLEEQPINGNDLIIKFKTLQNSYNVLREYINNIC